MNYQKKGFMHHIKKNIHIEVIQCEYFSEMIDLETIL